MAAKGSVWVSALLYLALGLVIIGLVIGLATPIVNRISDRNVYAQTKTVMVTIDHAITEVVNEGPGSRRYLSSVEIRNGELAVDVFENTVSWSLLTGSELVEPGILFEEGPLNIYLQDAPVQGEYELLMNMSYEGVADLDFTGESLGSPFSGEFSMTIENAGFTNPNVPIVLINVQQ